MLKPRKFLRIMQASAGGSSQRWLLRQKKDRFVQQSRTDGYRCRSAYKLLEINKKFKILKPGKNVVDLGACPGSWSQVAQDFVFETEGNQGGAIVAVDLKEMAQLPKVQVLTGADFTMPSTQKAILQLLPHHKADVIISDMAPNSCGNSYTDHVRIIELCEAVYAFCFEALASRGSMLCKVWDGPLLKGFKKDIEKKFQGVHVFKPMSSRKESAEMYLVALGFKNTKFDS